MITFLNFGDAQVIECFLANFFAFGLFLVAIRYFAKSWKVNEIFSLKT
tara:strand:+ start:306 stop:449 length:144 start_codon:yes stop_codon:yes gene_type:complete